MGNFITVIIPLYNKEKYIEKTIMSILNQTYKHYEIIIIDDMSTDNGYLKACQVQQSGKARDSSFKVYQNEINKGVSYTRNKGIEIANGDYIFFLDADDEISDENLFKSINVFIEKYGAHYILLTRNYYGKVLKPSPHLTGNIDELETDFYKIREKELFAEENNFPFGGSGSAVLSVKCIKNARFDQNEPLFEDWLFFMSIYLITEVFYYSKDTIFINYDKNSTFKTNTNKSELSKIPSLYWLLNQNEKNNKLRKRFFWIWLKGDITKNKNREYIKGLYLSNKKFFIKNFQLNKYSIYSMLMITLYIIKKDR